MKYIKTGIIAVSFSFLGGCIALVGYLNFVQQKAVVAVKKSIDLLQPTAVSYASKTVVSDDPIDFVTAAEKTVHAVVHVKNTSIKTQQNTYADFFYNQRGRARKYEQVGTGSGVVISSDGYIVTNGHVVSEATELEITLNNRKKYSATLIGIDEKNDIALLKIDTGYELPYIPFGNSDSIQVGEWVLAVGNPYNLTSTVTAGIVSAKGRDLEGNGTIDSFIQTDAAVNPGNSGGALVNTRGELMGINTAISSKTGSYIGYSFAVPSNIAKKIVNDLLEFGDVQEALLGFSPEMTASAEIEGVQIGSFSELSGAQKAGLEIGDVIVKLDAVKITKFSDLKGQLTAKRPGDKVAVTVLRAGKEVLKTVALRKSTLVEVHGLKIVLQDVSAKEQKDLRISGGAKIVSNANQNLHYYGVRRGFVITKINKRTVSNAAVAKKLLLEASRNKEPLHVEMLNLQGEKERYAFR